MAFEYSIKLKQEDIENLYVSFSLKLVSNFNENETTKDAKICESKVEITNSSSWGKWFELYREESGFYFWVNANRKERELILKIIHDTLFDLKISEFTIIDLDE